MPRLVKPSIKYKTSFLSGLKEFQQEGRETDKNREGISRDFSGFVKKLKDRERGINLPKGYVPDTHFWLVVGNDYLGTVSIRHRLTKRLNVIGGHIGYEIRPSQRKKGYGKKILKLVLPQARKMSLKRVLLTCGHKNIASRKIIESNDGIFQNKVKRGNSVQLRFWITLKK